MNILLAIIGISCFATLFAEFSGIGNYLKFRFDIGKPFNCGMCLSFWIALIYFTFNLCGIESIVYAATSSVLSIYIIKYAK
jgi:hypothetical protein